VKRLAAVSALVALSAAPLAGCSPPTIGQLAIHRLGNGSLNAVIVGCESGLQQVTAYVGELSDATPTAARWRLHVDPNTRLLVEWPLLGDDSTDVLAVSPLRQIPSHGEINLLASTADGEASATSIGLTPEELQRLPPGAYDFYGLNGYVRYSTRQAFLAHAC
jgi:hypothetical protein